MFRRFTERASRVVYLAREEARMLNHDYIGTEHILLGLIHEGEGVAATALESLGIALEGVRQQVEEIIGQGRQAPSGHIPFTPRAKKVLELSLPEALQLGHSYVGTEHILLGLIREGEGVAAQVLVKLGAHEDRVRDQVLGLLAIGTWEQVDRLAAPAELVNTVEQLAQVRRRKEAALDAGDTDTAAAMRDREQQLLADKLRLESRWAAEVGAVIAEIKRVHRELERLRGLLRQHGIEPNGGTTRTA
jgi:ATP-dependent Clp protease ATP-binding subunit ClpA